MAEAALRLGRCGVKAPFSSTAQSGAVSRVGETIPRLPAYGQPLFLVKPASLFWRAVLPRRGLQAGFRVPKSVSPCRGFLPISGGRKRMLGRWQDQEKGPSRGVRTSGRGQVEPREYSEPFQGCESSDESGGSTQAGVSETGGLRELDDTEVPILPHYALGLESPQKLSAEKADNQLEGDIGRKGGKAVEIDNEGGEKAIDEQWGRILVTDPKVAARHPLHQAFLQVCTVLWSKYTSVCFMFGFLAVTQRWASLLGCRRLPAKTPLCKNKQLDMGAD